MPITDPQAVDFGFLVAFAEDMYVQGSITPHDEPRIAAAGWDVTTIPKGNILQVACALLRLHEDPVSLDGATAYPLTFDRPICAVDPPPPDLGGEAAPAAAAKASP